MNEANTLLCKKGKIPSGDIDRIYAIAIKDALANCNMNVNFVQFNPCQRSF